MLPRFSESSRVIVFCHLLNDNSGSPRVLQQTIRALHADGNNLLFIGSQGQGVLSNSDLEIRRYWYRRSKFRIITLFTFVISQLCLYRALSRSKDIPEDAVIYVNTLLPFGAALWGWRNQREVIYHVHEVSITPKPLKTFLVGVARKTASRAVYVSDDNRARMPIDGVASSVVSNPVDPDLVAEAEPVVYRPRRSGMFNVLMLASARDFKGIPEFLGLARSLEDRSDISFTLVLNANQAEIDGYLSSDAIPASVTVHSRISDPGRFYAVADLVLNLSRVDLWIETFGMTLTEAMTFGVPIIAPPIGGPAEIVSDGEEGFLIDSREAAKLVDCVTRIADDADLALSMSQAARERARTYLWSTFADRLRDEVASLKNTKRNS